MSYGHEDLTKRSGKIVIRRLMDFGDEIKLDSGVSPVFTICTSDSTRIPDFHNYTSTFETR